MPTSIISSETISAYLETDFTVYSEPPFILNIDRHSSSLANLYQAHAVNSAAFITAFNPYSKQLTDEENRARHEQLLVEIKQLNIMAIPGMGQDPNGQWPGETSLLAIGIEEEVARRLGEEYEQNAIVWCGSDAIPELILLR